MQVRVYSVVSRIVVHNSWKSFDKNTKTNKLRLEHRPRLSTSQSTPSWACGHRGIVNKGKSKYSNVEVICIHVRLRGALSDKHVHLERYRPPQLSRLSPTTRTQSTHLPSTNSIPNPPPAHNPKVTPEQAHQSSDLSFPPAPL